MDFMTIKYSQSTLAANSKALAYQKQYLTMTNKGKEAQFKNVNGVEDAISGKELTEKEKRIVEKLKKRDAEVRQHEEAHIRAAGTLANGGPNYKYKIGPDGKRYAIGGNVQIDTSEVPNNPKATIDKAKKIKRAALAPMNPSPKDRAVATQASNMEIKAKAELQKEKKEVNDKKLFSAYSGTYDSNGKILNSAESSFSYMVL